MSLLTLPEAEQKRRELGEAGSRVVFTNGCFDLVHAGHLHLFRTAARQGDHLFVGLNTDASVSRLKGPERPLMPESDRAELLDALEPVDDVILFDQDTPLKLIKTVRPDVLVKGADYEKSEIVGAGFVESIGGRVHRAQLKEGKGTSQIIEKIVAAYGGDESDE